MENNRDKMQTIFYTGTKERERIEFLQQKINDLKEALNEETVIMNKLIFDF